MNNTIYDYQKYTSFIDYQEKLSSSMKKFDTAFWHRPPKQMGSFNVTMRNIVAILYNIKEIQIMRDEMRKLTTLDFEAKNGNKSARKAAEQISSIREELRQSDARLKDEFFKQMDLAGKQCREVSRTIKDKDESARFYEAMKDFESMVFESRTAKFRIPIDEKDDLTQLGQDQARREHEEQERQIDNITNFELQDTDGLYSALSALTAILATTPTDDLAKEVRKEVAQIKKALPPKTIAIAKDNLERLRHSSHLLLDLEQISEIMKTTHRFMGNDGKLQKINKKLEALQPLLEQAIREERERNMGIKQEHDDVQSKVDYATDAVKTYGSILGGNARLEQEQIQISNNTHELYDVNTELKEDEKEANTEAQKIQMKPMDRQEWNDDLKVEQLYERARSDRQEVRDNEAYMADKMSERAVAILPPEYTDMKKRLQSVSSLYRVSMIQSQELSNGGKSR